MGSLFSDANDAAEEIKKEMAQKKEIEEKAKQEEQEQLEQEGKLD